MVCQRLDLWLGGFTRQPCIRWDRRAAKIAAQEFYGAFIFIFFICMLPLGQGILVSIAMPLVMLFAVASSVAQVNPTISFAYCLMDLMPWDELLYRMLFQLVGSFAGYSLLYYIMPGNMKIPTTLICYPLRGFLMNKLQHFFAEMFLSFFLAMFFISYWTNVQWKRSAFFNSRFVFGGTAIFLAAFPAEGASMNVVRALPPFFFYLRMREGFTYIVAPFIGAFLAATFWKFMFELSEMTDDERKKAQEDEAQKAADKAARKEAKQKAKEAKAAEKAKSN